MTTTAKVHFIKDNTLETVYGKDMTYEGVNITSKLQLVEFLNNINNIKIKGLAYLREDKKQISNDLPVQNVSDSLINLTTTYETSYNTYFETGTRYLKENDVSNLKVILNVHDGFLGIKIFKHNFVIFDPRPNITVSKDERPMFPGYEPIYSKTTKDELLKYVYTVAYPKVEIPAFPNFRVGNFAINGEIYNPLYDFRNFRLLGTYDFEYKKIDEEKFNSSPMSSLNGYFVEGMYLCYNSEYFHLIKDYSSSGSVYTSKYTSTYQKVSPSKIRFSKITKEIYDLNPTHHIPI